MQDLHRQGAIRAIGVSNFYPDRLVDLIEHNETTPAVNQVETHPYFQRADYQQLMAGRGVQIESWGPLAEGRNNIFSDPTLTAIGQAHGRSVAPVTLRWLTQRGVVVIPKSSRPERMAENLDVFDCQLTDNEMNRIATLDTGGSIAIDHRGPCHGQPPQQRQGPLNPAGTIMPGARPSPPRHAPAGLGASASG